MIPSRQNLLVRALIEIDEDGQIVQATPEASALLGWKRGDLVSQRIFDNLTAGKSFVEVNGGSGDRIALKAYAFTGRAGWLMVPLPGHVSPGPDPSQLFPKGELTYRAFFEQAPIGIVHLDPGGRVTFENHVLRQMFGERPDDAWIGRSIFSVDEIDGFLLPLIGRMLVEGKSFDACESEYSGTTGIRSWMRVSGTAIRNHDGEVAGGVMTLQDITDLKKAKAVMEKARSDAEAASRMKTDLIATLSHELRTPVGTIRGYADMLSEELSEDDESVTRATEFAGVIRERAHDLEGLVSDLVQFAHLETGLIVPHLKQISLGDVIGEVIVRVSAANTTSVEVRVSMDESARCIADPALLGSVLKRIIDNALKFTLEGHVDVTTSACGSTARIEVADSGIGMDEHYLGRIFDPVTPEESALNRRFEGAGLGLAIARRLIDLMGGSVEIDSAPGCGTRVTIELPAVEPGQGAD